MVGNKTPRGKQAMRAWMASMDMEPPKFTVDNIIAEGDVVTAYGDMTMKDKDGKEHAHEILPTTQVTCDGKPCKLTDLRAGLKIRVTTKKGDKTPLKIEALDKNKAFGPG